MTTGTSAAALPPTRRGRRGDSTPPETPTPETPRSRSTTLGGVLVKIAFLSVVAAATVWVVPLLIAYRMWMWLAIVVVAALAIFALYATKHFIPGKYIFPGSLFLSLFLIVPIILTVGYSFTNFGDGTRGTKEQAIAAIVGGSVQQTPDSPRYALTVATQGDPATGPFQLFLVEQGDTSGTVVTGNAELALQEFEGEATVADGRVTEVTGYEVLTPQQINAVYADLQELSVQAGDSAVRVQGVNAAYLGEPTLAYDEQQDAIVSLVDGTVYPTGMVGDTVYFVDANGDRAFSQSWLQPVGLSNYQALFGNAEVLAQFVDAFVWTLVFAGGSVLTTFALGFFLALVMNDDRIRGQRFYRSFLLLPYAIPGFISLLVWSNFYNREYGLINDLLGLNLDWMGDPTLAKAAVLLTNLWMGFPYMFVVCTGALQSIPSDVKEAARIDGANPLQATMRVVMPLLLVAVAPLLVASFAFNFNNFNAIELLTQGGPFPAGEYTRGATDILISMVYRIAFGGSGADFGFASAVAVMLFLLTGIIAALQFRFTTVLEDVN